MLGSAPGVRHICARQAFQATAIIYATLSSSTCTLSCALTVRTFVLFRRLNKNRQREHAEDYRILRKQRHLAGFSANSLSGGGGGEGVSEERGMRDLFTRLSDVVTRRLQSPNHSN